ncbi:oligoendopeptidase F [Alkalihalobacillus alcalophilus ATCC 27647 = CGMCC 1.3604]|uniref:Oligoendopeptidase F n=1 Tax=Alkalihalobacillus alcalophilus ATCC 27647 = CGMCC 1.3604 TaxID=1218173 RepID=A0A094WCN6_ALKAL|nr:M3 family oligoendopeptidase [Alkalihalobacillus alcalophilus]KGA95549.1 oligoendopeptidase F [Alkalihalobacillus alcalophilus ATCC 27647 = CGMCC 1.3604]MED1562467.1 M3 family oligoendopeptidase [Alkalihalobacillus alcalophilus]THG89702.1 oligoendopeptidase F [Alkalihalobacillus alcalophilus ATCC 27647 = CGMCC 1.3604]
MISFENYTYERPNVQSVKEDFKLLLKEFTDATNVKAATTALEKINQFRSKLSTMYTLTYIRSSIDTNDDFYQKERDFFDEISPELDELNTALYQELIKSPCREALEKKWGAQLFDIADFQIKSFSPEVIHLLQKENKLTSEYAKLVASAEIEFQGESYTLAQLAPFTQDHKRNIRQEATNASFGFFASHSERFDEIYDQLVKVRHEIATTLGYKNFVELGYIRMLRIDYNAEMVEVFRKQVRDVIVPLASKLYKKQANRIGVDSLKFYDENFKYKTGNAKPKGSPEWIIDNGKKMYEELSPETKEFFQFMLDRNLMDLEAKKGKEAGGYCTFIEDYQAPFIFANFNGTSDDLDVLTHEVGHAFQCYLSRDIGIPEYLFPTHEACEIHSMSMEFLTWPWMELFFKEDTDKYKYSHLATGLQFLPYGVAVDEFQHLIYENPEWTPTERKQAWKQLEEIYLPHRDYDGNAYLEEGNLWKRQGHIYKSPFYYIDYTLAQICAFQFWKRSQENKEKAWNDYLNLCKLGGSKSFLELVEAASLASPFEEGMVETVVKTIEDWLESVDDQAL